MNLGLPSTLTKLRSVSAMLAVFVSPERCGSLKNTSTTKNIRKTLRAAIRNTIAVGRCSLITPASDRSPENRQEPYQAAKEPRQIRSALRRKVENFVKVAR